MNFAKPSIVGAALAALTGMTLASSARADNVLVWDGGQSHTGITAAVTRLTALGHTVTRVSTVPADLTPFDNLWAMDYLNGPDAANERTMVQTFLDSDRGVFAQYEWDCCTNSQVNWTATLTPLLVSPFLISGSQGVSQDAVAEPGEVFGLTTNPNAIPLLQINATANITTIPAANVVYRLNGIPVVGAYVDPQFISGHGCIVLSGDIEQMFSAPQANAWIENVQTFLQGCVAVPPEVCGDGFLAAAEACDDGNTADGDGCSSACAVEPGWACVNDVSQDPVSTCDWDCAGIGTPCSAGVGECLATGSVVCTGPGVAGCDAMPGSPTPEVCDGLDNDCDGTPDQGDPGGGAACATGLPGVCSAGLTSCVAGALSCVATILPGTQVETCNGLDDDCDGTPDDGNPGSGVACSSGLPGVCDAGLTNCAAGTIQCVATITPGTQVETCNGLDDDCDGTPDDGNPGGGVACSSGLPGVCDPGLTTCGAGGTIQCVATILPGTQVETCNGLDDDCDGTPDDGFNVGASCTNGVGACVATGAIVCDALGGATCNAVPGTPTAEVCNAIDDDCNGTPDDGNPGGGVACSSGLPGVCDPGLTTCAAGAIQCVATITPGSQIETCNALDDDCDGTADEGFGLGDACTNGLGICEASGVVVCDLGGGAVCDAVPGTPETELCSDTIDSDCDGDPNNGCLDTDGDGLTDDYETLIGTDPLDADSDDDGVIDGLEPSPAEDSDGDGLINALDPDSDNDGLFDGTEMGFDCSDPDTDATAGNCTPDADAGATTTDPLDADTDDGGVSDGSEDTNLNGAIDPGETDPNDPSDDVGILDTDGDGLSDALEIAIGTDPNDADTDDDGVIDGLEANPTSDTDGDGLINALDPDSDDDGLFDGTEMGLDCSNPDTDLAAGTCIPDGDGGATTTSPLDPDTDHGSVLDGVEDANHNGVIDPGETDPNDPSDDIECQVDADCGGLSSGSVCDDQHACIDGCRGEGGNGCPDGEVCTSTDATIGECVAGTGGSGGTGGAAPQPQGASVEGGGCGCRLPAGDEREGGYGYLAALALGAAFSLRRRRRSP